MKAPWNVLWETPISTISSTLFLACVLHGNGWIQHWLPFPGLESKPNRTSWMRDFSASGNRTFRQGLSGNCLFPFSLQMGWSACCWGQECLAWLGWECSCGHPEKNSTCWWRGSPEVMNKRCMPTSLPPLLFCSQAAMGEFNWRGSREDNYFRRWCTEGHSGDQISVGSGGCVWKPGAWTSLWGWDGGSGEGCPAAGPSSFTTQYLTFK